VIRPVTEPSHAVFLSYASQDAEAAHKICDALRAAGIEVWFDRSELRGGDAWDQAIRKQIKTCALFIPVISRTTHDRREGYFRLEWKLAVDRSHLMDSGMAFLLPIVIDDTRDDDERVPERFREVQWTRLPGGVTPAAFVERVGRLLSGEVVRGSTVTPSDPARAPGVAPSVRKPVLAFSWSKTALLATIAVLAVALGYLVTNRLTHSKRSAALGPAVQSAPATATFSPPAHSIAVLPFINLSGDNEQEYFSDGLTEELLNSLARINELQVAARTSSFSFQGEHPDIATVAHKLNVGAILEGSVRRSAHTIRITAQLINAVTGFHLWSQTYDRDPGDVLKLQTEIANAVAGALQVKLLGDVASKIELGGTHNPAAFDAYLRALNAYNASDDKQSLERSIDAYTEAIRLDPGYALAFAGRSFALGSYAFASINSGYLKAMQRSEPDARRALAMAPELAEGHLALAIFLRNSLDFSRGNEEYERAYVLAPGSALILRSYGLNSVYMGRPEAGIAASRRAVMLDPLNRVTRSILSEALYRAHQYEQAVSLLHSQVALYPDDAEAYAYEGLSYYALNQLENARASCEAKRNNEEAEFLILPCLAIIYDKLGRHADAEAVLRKEMASTGDSDAYQYAEVYAQRGDLARALTWLGTALRLRDVGLKWLKTDPLLDPLRKEARFQAIERELMFPN
jgi:TolB-like protein/Tfp pilus assembly protein PilF